MSGKSPYASEAERKAAKRASERLRNEQIHADPVLYEKLLMRKREAWARASEKKKSMKAQPAPFNVKLYRTHGPWAPLFALQAAA